MENVSVYFIFILVITLASVNSEYTCNMTSSKISCIGLYQNEASNGLRVFINGLDVLYLNITESNISEITEESFAKFTYMHTLHITKSAVKNVRSGAFTNNIYLGEVHLVDNYLTELNSSVFTKNNAVRILDLSHNYLNDLSAFNISDFPQLSILNLTNNRLKYLPIGVIKKLNANNNIYVIVDNNPFDCDHPSWNHYLNQELIDIFCTNNTYNYYSNKFSDSRDSSLFKSGNKIKELNDIILENVNQNDDESGNPKPVNGTTANEKKVSCTASCSFYICVAWFAGGIWLGIIIGNAFKIKKLLFDKHKASADKNTQYGNGRLRTEGESQSLQSNDR